MAEPQFHLFGRLPRELQLMIWEEARPSHRHLFYLDRAYDHRLVNVGCRIYTCLETKTDTVVQRTAGHKAPALADRIDVADWFDSDKVRLTGRIMAVNDSEDDRTRYNLHKVYSGDLTDIEDIEDWHVLKPEPYPTSVYMNFERDVFAFKSNDLCLLDFLKTNYKRNQQAPLPDGHWFFKVQKLAFPLVMNWDSLPFYLQPPQTMFDVETLGRARELKIVYLVVARSWDCPRDRNGELKLTWNADAFAPYQDWVQAHSLKPHQGEERCNCNLVVSPHKNIRKRLEELFKDHQRKPQIQLVVERRVHW
ncbi:uncharacterized protein JN550_005728 [Neoarthrinium moseri]|uniref:uncharacterized protein n=1 Tax=Neoarthrinium moseri TaxID=1658444 RepID=UPI001FDD289F|nr:uncharacterized protein JN550_005728 [Neoarthrinium moseri]KAI1869747.1 hypothetical protein JN550_005728 [Neoarthrinium moseri]